MWELDVMPRSPVERTTLVWPEWLRRGMASAAALVPATGLVVTVIAYGACEPPPTSVLHGSPGHKGEHAPAWRRVTGIMAGDPAAHPGGRASPPVVPAIFAGDLRDLPIAAGPRPAGPARARSRMARERAPAALPGAGTPFPDPRGARGSAHALRMIDGPDGSRFVIYDQDGHLRAGPTRLASMWSSPWPSREHDDSACATGRGAPTVLYDPLAGRWLMSETAAAGNHLCIYVSMSSDPVAGGWFLYAFETPERPEHPRYGVWPDAFYVSTRESGVALYALERLQMLVGNPATFQRFTVPPLSSLDHQVLVPGNLAGATPPPLSAPGIFVRQVDDELHAPPGNPTRDFLELWELDIDFLDPTGSQLTGPVRIPVADFDSDPCALPAAGCAPRPGAAIAPSSRPAAGPGSLQYRRAGSRETLVGRIATGLDGTGHGGMRWFELRKTDAGWTLFQEGIHAPDQVHDPMGRTARGDAGATSAEPADACTFWHTGEYLPESGRWRTRIASFRLERCSPATRP